MDFSQLSLSFFAYYSGDVSLLGQEQQGNDNGSSASVPTIGAAAAPRASPFQVNAPAPSSFASQVPPPTASPFRGTSPFVSQVPAPTASPFRGTAPAPSPFVSQVPSLTASPFQGNAPFASPVPAPFLPFPNSSFGVSQNLSSGNGSSISAPAPSLGSNNGFNFRPPPGAAPSPGLSLAQQAPTTASSNQNGTSAVAQPFFDFSNPPPTVNNAQPFFDFSNPAPTVDNDGDRTMTG
eukprot:CAMPEP_0172476202 /NCGR_PEP_ID=MMETSP1065-20121228/70257_1 /TAXON_ID=265537 /ORGANISM="Amphiprora paludosa, Strain CCMP125" /LENGTH=235 /DNA_ID=CAMNT_0013234423 /DNA_START=557 /DNA_END=1264 /DNA_ORIENTATION=+